MLKHKATINAKSSFENAFDLHPESNKHQVWFLLKKLPGPIARCCGCKCKEFNPSDWNVSVEALYVPPMKTAPVLRTFRFCVSKTCVQKKPYASNVVPLRMFKLKLSEQAGPCSSAELTFVQEAGFEMV